MRILLKEKDLSRRETRIRKLLRPLLEKGKDVAAKRYAVTCNSMIYSVYSGSSPITQNYRDIRFRTFSKSVLGNYFEIWEKETGDKWTLSNAYLKLVDGDNKEILSLHCDPKFGNQIEQYRYKCGPHLHVQHPYNSVLSNAHIALNLSNIQEVISSIENLEFALGTAIEMLFNEIIQKVN